MNNILIVIIIIILIMIYPMFMNGLKQILKDLILGITYFIAAIIKSIMFIYKWLKRNITFMKNQK